MTVTRIPDGTDVCFYGYIHAKIGGYNGVDHLMVDRDDGGPNIWSSNFTVGVCTPGDEPDDGEPDDGIPPVDDISELTTDISSLLGDIKPFHVIIAVIIMIIIGLLS